MMTTTLFEDVLLDDAAGAVGRRRRPTGRREATPPTWDELLDALPRLEAATVKTPGCWWWTGAISGGRGGYGRIHIGSAVRGTRQMVGVHRVVAALKHGGWPDRDLEASHACHEMLCVNFGHIDLEDHASNVAASARAGHHGGPTRARTGAELALRSRAIRDAVVAAHEAGDEVQAAVDAVRRRLDRPTTDGSRQLALPLGRPR